jgi:hypothetical protein
MSHLQLGLPFPQPCRLETGGMGFDCILAPIGITPGTISLQAVGGFSL